MWRFWLWCWNNKVLNSLTCLCDCISKKTGADWGAKKLCWMWASILIWASSETLGMRDPRDLPGAHGCSRQDGVTPWWDLKTENNSLKMGFQLARKQVELRKRCFHAAVQGNFHHSHHLQCWLASSPHRDPIWWREREREKECERERITTWLLPERETSLAVIGQEVGCLDLQALLLSVLPPPSLSSGQSVQLRWLPSVDPLPSPPPPPFPLSVRLSSPPIGEKEHRDRAASTWARLWRVFPRAFAPRAAAGGSTVADMDLTVGRTPEYQRRRGLRERWATGWPWFGVDLADAWADLKVLPLILLF